MLTDLRRTRMSALGWKVTGWNVRTTDSSAVELVWLGTWRSNDEPVDTAQRPQDLNLQQHCCENIQSRIPTGPRVLCCEQNTLFLLGSKLAVSDNYRPLISSFFHIVPYSSFNDYPPIWRHLIYAAKKRCYINTAPNMCTRRVELKLCIFSASALGTDDWSVSRSGRFKYGERFLGI